MTVQPNDYGVVHTKTRREVVLLNSVGGCSWGRCAFCEYHDTYSRNAQQARVSNRRVLDKVSGIYDTLQIVCSASFPELPMSTWYDIREVCRNKGIKKLIIELHWTWREEQSRIVEFFDGIEILPIYGVETFDFFMREVCWFKGYGRITPAELRKYAWSVNLLIGVKEQTMEGITADVQSAVEAGFGLINLLVFAPNDTTIERDNDLCEQFYQSELFQNIKNNPQFEIVDGLDRRAPDNIGNVGAGSDY